MIFQKAIDELKLEIKEREDKGETEHWDLGLSEEKAKLQLLEELSKKVEDVLEEDLKRYLMHHMELIELYELKSKLSEIKLND